MHYHHDGTCMRKSRSSSQYLKKHWVVQVNAQTSMYIGSYTSEILIKLTSLVIKAYDTTDISIEHEMCSSMYIVSTVTPVCPVFMLDLF